ncbi:ABC transporter ATP-binding protein [Pseudonocardia ailaonensis]|uniref:ABC transporter ATP-binding protein n=1 Tax=Pseudonocardia ailaonensis TaxID=367279 RepID=A0ABN2N6B0_9PSEU
MTTTPEATATAPPVLELRGVSVHYGGVKAVDRVSMSMAEGKIYGVIGPNGSGKSTLIGAITRLVPLTAGELLLDAVPYSGARAHRLVALGVSRTFQTVRLIPNLTVYENVELGADLRRPGQFARRVPGLHPTREELAAAVDRAITVTGLDSLRRRLPAELSYGAQRRVEIARAIAARPRFLLLDEPTAGMNQIERHEIADLMHRLCSAGISQLLVEHDVQMVVDTTDHVFAMTAGTLVTEGRPEDVIRDPRVQEAYLGRRWRHDA